eukprot:31511-Pelagococcus_subviridis.AAC.4
MHPVFVFFTDFGTSPPSPSPSNPPQPPSQSTRSASSTGVLSFAVTAWTSRLLTSNARPPRFPASGRGGRAVRLLPIRPRSRGERPVILHRHVFPSFRAHRSPTPWTYGVGACGDAVTGTNAGFPGGGDRGVGAWICARGDGGAALTAAPL